MRAILRWAAVLALVIAAMLPAMPAGARPKDPESFRVTQARGLYCSFGASFGDPFTGRCSPRSIVEVDHRSLWPQQAELIDYCFEL